MSRLDQELRRIRPALAAAAQKVYDDWDKDEVGDGGICDSIADEMTTVVINAISDVQVRGGGHDGDDHAWIIVQRASTREAFGVDIPPSVYETGAGYQWSKIEGVTIEPADVQVFQAVYEDDDWE